ncbi:hypothetical protein H1R20_g13321, partial [Candolleomyces eurysporus]
MMDPGDDDPFAIFLRHPKDESNAERVAREIREAEAKKRSEDIDQEIVEEKERLMRAEEFQTRVALLGGSESGKFEMIKNLRMHHGREEWNAELAKWRCVIQLKLVKSVIIILDALEAEGRGERLTAIEELRQLVLLRLAPLRRVEQNLRRVINASAEEITPAALDAQWQKEREDATMVIAMCREDIKSVWMGEKVQLLLTEGKIHFEDSAKFLFEGVDRITSRDYTPSDEDVAHVRLRPVVQECRIKFQRSFDSTGGVSETEWRIYDIATQRMSKNAWIPYFEGLLAIMFFVDISGFNKPSLDGSRLTRLEDSFMLWRTICGSQLLQETGLILFLTNCHLLQQKLELGIQVKDYVPSYGDRPNDVGRVVECQLSIAVIVVTLTLQRLQTSKTTSKL